MEQRTEIIKRFNVNRRQSLLYEEEIDGVIKLSVRKPSISSFEDKIVHNSQQFQLGSPIGDQQQASAGGAGNVCSSEMRQTSNAENYPMVELAGERANRDTLDRQQQRMASEQQQQQQENDNQGQTTSGAGRPGNFLSNMRPDEINVRRMQTALTLNKAIVDRSKNAKLVIINLPGAPKDTTPEAENNCK